MVFIAAALLLFLLSGLCALFLNNRPATAAALCAPACIAGCLAALFPVFAVFFSGQEMSFDLLWPAAGGLRVFFTLDRLSAFFLVPMLLLSALTALYGWGYLRRERNSESCGRQWFFFNMLVASLLSVFLAADGLFFLLCWETMALSSFFLVVSRDEEESVRRAGFIYLAASHAGTAALFVVFAFLAAAGNSGGFWNSAAFPGPGTGVLRVLLLSLGIFGFGMKAGFIPFHFWLPRAHPAAPSHVSALMSGVMIKAGIYGILRMFSVTGGGEVWCGAALIIAGICSGILAMLSALNRRDTKSVLAYSSIENIGIICMGTGLAVYAASCGGTLVCLLALSGALLHLFNHAFFKGLLFMAAGAAGKSCGSRDPDALGGCAKTLPVTSSAFFLGAAAASGVPLLNGFPGKFLIYLAAFCGLQLKGSGLLLPSTAVIAGLSLSGCLSLACFTGLSGIVFLGKPRSRLDRPEEYSALMGTAMISAAAACLFLAFAAPLLSFSICGAVSAVFASTDTASAPGLADRLAPLSCASAWAFALIAAALAAKRLLLRRRKVSFGETWNCAYAAADARMQYTSASFFYPLRRTFTFFNSRRSPAAVSKTIFFPGEYEGNDSRRIGAFRTFLSGIAAKLEVSLSCLRWLQQGRLHIYIMYIMAALLALLLWKIR